MSFGGDSEAVLEGFGLEKSSKSRPKPKIIRRSVSLGSPLDDHVGAIVSTTDAKEDNQIC
jgi:hypothetical protein